MHAVLGDLAGEVVFGLMMQALGMTGMVAMLDGSKSVPVGWGVHLVISAVFGAVYGALLAPRVSGWGGHLVGGGLHGVVLWVVGPLLLMPAQLGIPLFTINAVALQSLVGHVVFGLVLCAVVAALGRQAWQ